MKKYIIILVILVLVMMTIWNISFPKEEYSIPINEMDIDSVTIYYMNENVSKNIESETDIIAIVDMLNSFSLVEIYQIDEKLYHEHEAGALGFGLIFYLKDGTEWICAYYQTSSSGDGRFADGDFLGKVSNLNILELWNALSYTENRDFPSEEYMFPSVY